MDKLIDIIIPAYNSHKTITRTLGSIVSQTEIDKVRVTIVNDGGINYKDIINIFNEYMDIQELSTSFNKGPGVARQYGIDHTTCPYIMFIDADDTLQGAFSLKMFLHDIQSNDNCAIVTAAFLEPKYKPELQFEVTPANMTWMFSKLYRRTFIEKYNIRFNETRSCEDTGFNALVELCLIVDQDNLVIKIDQPLYCWHYNRESITRANNHEFFIKECSTTYVENIIDVMQKGEKLFPGHIALTNKAIDVIVMLYYAFCQYVYKDRRYYKENLQSIIKYYNVIFKKYEDATDPIYFTKQLIECSKKRSYMFEDVLPDYTLRQFLGALREALYVES